MNQQDLLNNAAFQNMSPEKLAFLADFISRSKPDNSGDMLSFLMGFVGKAQKSGIRFSQSETDFVIEHLKESMSPQERRRADLIVQMMRNRNSSR